MITKIPNRLWALAEQGVSSLGNFLQIFLLAKFMTLHDFGLVVLCFSILRFLEGFQSAITSTPLNVLGARLDGEEYRQFYQGISLIQLVLLMFLGLITLVIGWVCSSHWPELSWIMGFSLVLPLYLWHEYYRMSIYASLTVFRSFFNTSVRHLVFFGIFYLGYTRDGEISLQWAFWCISLAALTPALPGLFNLWRQLFSSKASGPLNGLAGIWHQSWEFGRWMLGTTFVRAFGSNGYAWVISIILGVESLGIYRAAIQLVNVMNPFRQIVVTFLPAQASRAYKQQGQSGLLAVIKTNAAFLAVPVLVISLCLMAAPGQLLTLAYGDKFDGHGLELVMILASAAFLLSFSVNFLQVIIVAMKNSKAIFSNSMLHSAILIFVGIPLIYSLGYLGAPVAQFIASLASVPYLLFIYKKQTNEVSA